MDTARQSCLRRARHLVHFLRQTRDPTRSCVELEHALAHAASDFRFGGAQRILRDFWVTTRDGLLHLLDERADPAGTRAVDFGALGGLPDALFGGGVMGHDVPFSCFWAKRGV